MILHKDITKIQKGVRILNAFLYILEPLLFEANPFFPFNFTP